MRGPRSSSRARRPHATRRRLPWLPARLRNQLRGAERLARPRAARRHRGDGWGGILLKSGFLNRPCVLLHRRRARSERRIGKDARNRLSGRKGAVCDSRFGARAVWRPAGNLVAVPCGAEIVDPITLDGLRRAGNRHARIIKLASAAQFPVPAARDRLPPLASAART
jgi:hypothetical protein